VNPVWQTIFATTTSRGFGSRVALAPDGASALPGARLPGTTRSEQWISRIFDQRAKLVAPRRPHGSRRLGSGFRCSSRSDCGRPCERRDLYAAASRFWAEGVATACKHKNPVVMGPCVRRGDGCALWLPNWYRFICLVPLHLSNSPPCAGTASRSRRTFRAGFTLSFRPLVNRGRRECRVMASPMARLQQKSRRQSPQVQPDQPAFPAQWF
jgi:hypothetical protein